MITIDWQLMITDAAGQSMSACSQCNLYPSWVFSQRPILGHLCINWRRGKG